MDRPPPGAQDDVCARSNATPSRPAKSLAPSWARERVGVQFTPLIGQTPIFLRARTGTLRTLIAETSAVSVGSNDGIRRFPGTLGNPRGRGDPQGIRPGCRQALARLFAQRGKRLGGQRVALFGSARFTRFSIGQTPIFLRARTGTLPLIAETSAVSVGSNDGIRRFGTWGTREARGDPKVGYGQGCRQAQPAWLLPERRES